MTTPVCKIDATGIHAPTYADCLAWYSAQYQGVYGSDVNLDPSTQDGQWLAIQAKALSDANAMAVAVYNAFSPSTAQGTGLSSVVKINGIARKIATNSTCDLLIGGTVGTIITGGYATDAAGNQWNLPTTTIPIAGQITVTATCATLGAIAAGVGTITQIGTPTRGWQTVTNLAIATVGAPIEQDAQLRQRQAISTEQPSSTIAQGIEGAIAALSGVSVVKAYDNDTGSTDVNGIPGHSLSVVVEGGDASAIAAIISNKKTPGCGTFGNTTEVIIDPTSGIPKTIAFERPTDIAIDIVITLKALNKYTTLVGSQIQAAVAAYFDTLEPGDDVYLSKLSVPANLNGAAASITFNVLSIQAARHLLTIGSADIVMGYAERATCTADSVFVVVT